MTSPLNQARHIQIEDVEHASVREGRIRIRIGLAIFLVAMLIGVFRLAEVSLLNNAANTGSNSIAPPKYRADITDRNGEVLATTLNTYALYTQPKFVWNADETAVALNRVFPTLSVEMLKNRLTRKADEVLIKRGLTPVEKELVFLTGEPGLMFKVEPKRFYPRGDVGSHLVGYADVDMVGIAGAEKAFDREISPQNAPPLALSIDMRVQNTLREELQAGLEKFNAQTNAGIVLNIKTGEILAMSSLPAFDSNAPIAESPQPPRNHAAMSTYDLGSVFKPITMAMALDAGITDLEETFPVQKPLKIRGELISDDHYSPEPLNMSGIMRESSNRGTALMALRAGGEVQRAFFKKIGLMSRVPYGLSESTGPQVQAEWQDLTTATTSYGHGISVTPLALAVAVGAILNDGVYVKPTILKRDGLNPPETNRVVSSETSKTVRDLMRYVATDGTGRNAAVSGYDVMGKTGTADKPGIGGYDETALVTSFIAAFPYSDPEYVVFITYDEPKRVEGQPRATAGWNAAPTAGKVIERIAPILGVKRNPDGENLSPFSTPIGEALP